MAKKIRKPGLQLRGGTHTITASEMGRRGGIARAKKLTAAKRSEAARKAARARWKGHKKKAV